MSSNVLLVDTSVGVPLVVSDHENHDKFNKRVAGYSIGLSGHAVFETFSVLTRLPVPLRRGPGTVARIVEESFPETVYLSPDASESLLHRLRAGQIAGGSVYDALVGAAAAEAGLLMLSADKRAADTYNLLGVNFELLS